MGDEPARGETQGQQLFPVLTESELRRLHRFGVIRHYPAGSTVVAAGHTPDGFLFILSGTVAVTLRGVSGDAQQIATYGPGAFVGEVADLSRRPCSVTAQALGPLAVLAVLPESFQLLATGEAEIADRILRALILRLAGPDEATGGCPIIVGTRSSRECLRVENLLTQGGFQCKNLDPGTDKAVRSLLERLDIADFELPLVLCPDGLLLRNPTEHQLASALGPAGSADHHAN